MLRLRERAHQSLEAYKNSPSRHANLIEPTSPVHDQDELTILGGKTRTVAPKEKSVSPQILDKSPTTLNPVVPLPLGQGEPQVHPYVLEYLRTFGPSHDVSMGMATHHHMGGYQQAMQTLPTPISSSSVNFPLDAVPFHSPLPPIEGMPQQTLPQYFPVFDYGVGVNNVGDAFMGTPIENELLGRSYSPETNMQTSWQDFVAEIGNVQ